jgi:hypothetical protein
MNYFNSIVAPASSSLALISSASSFAAFSFITQPLSAKSLASFSPRPVTSLITLITAILLAPAEVSSTLKLDLPSPSPASHPAAPATITGAAADTPNSSSIAVTKSFSSTIDSSLTKSIIFEAFALNSAIIQKIKNVKYLFSL